MIKNHLLYWMAPAVLGMSLPACVTKSEYVKLQDDYAAYREQAAETQAAQQHQIVNLEAQIAEAEAAIAGYKQELASLRSQIDGLNREKVALTRDKSRLEATEQELAQALREVQERKLAAEKRIQEYRDLTRRFQSLIDSGKLRVRIIDGQMVVELATDVLFPTGSAVLSSDGRGAIVEVAQVLREIPNRRFQIAGHTDDVPIKTSRYRSNWDLGFDRAYSVLQAIIDEGMPESRISASSYGPTRPMVSNETREGKAQNRRIEIIVVPDLSELPGAEELEALGSNQG